MPQVSKAVLERAKKIMLEKNGKIPVEIEKPKSNFEKDNDVVLYAEGSKKPLILFH